MLYFLASKACLPEGFFQQRLIIFILSTVTTAFFQRSDIRLKRSNSKFANNIPTPSTKFLLLLTVLLTGRSLVLTPKRFTTGNIGKRGRNGKGFTNP